MSVWGWEDVEEHAVQHAEAWKAFDPTYTSYAERGFENVQLKISELTQSVEQLGNKIRFPSASQTAIRLDHDDRNTPRHGKITVLQSMIDDGHAKLTITQLLKLKNDEWADATPSERYRILVSIASAKLKLGHYEEAGTILVEAYGECPEHKNAQINRAKGHLLRNNHAEATRLARELLANGDSSADAAETLIQGLISDDTCDDPVKQLPEALHDTEKVLIARICFLRARDNLGWQILARTSAEKFPESPLLRLFAAEAVLYTVTRTSRDVIAGGILQNTTLVEFNNAVAELYSQARDAIEKDYALLPSTAQNAALALRLWTMLKKQRRFSTPR